MRMSSPARRSPLPSTRWRAWVLAIAALLAVLAFASVSPPASAALPPVAVIASPFNGTPFDAGAMIVFSANGSTDTDDPPSPLDYLWNFSGDVRQGPLERVVYYSNFTTPGNYTVTLTVIDNESLSDTDFVTIIIRPPNLPPVAAIAAPANGSRFFSDDAIPFSGAGSNDPDGGSLAYFWSSNLSGPLGTGENLTVRLSPGDYLVTLQVFDARGGESTTSIRLWVEVNVAPRVEGISVDPPSGFEGGSFTFLATYTEDNRQEGAFVLLILDGSPHPMARGSGQPATGVAYSLTLTLPAGRHAFYVLASDGKLTNLSATVTGPDVWTSLAAVTPDGFGAASLEVLPPANLTVVAYGGPLPVDPAQLLAVSLTYRVNASALDARNLTFSLAFAPSPGLNRSSASLYRVSSNGSAWLALVARLDLPGNTLSFSTAAADLPAIFRVYARREAAPPNSAPSLSIAYSGEAYPNSTLHFDSSNSTDPENATILFAWRFDGPGVSSDWIPGVGVDIAFPAAGVYGVTLRGDDGSGNVVFANRTIAVSERPLTIRDTLEEAAALLALAVAVVVSAVLAVWWRSRRPARKRSYDDLYGRAYKERLGEETEYAQLFERYAGRGDEGEPPAAEDPAEARD